MRNQKLVVCVGTVMAALLFAGCTADGQESRAGEESGAGPLWEALGFSETSGWGGDSLTASMVERETRVQDLVAQCMKDAGFDYVPFVAAPSDDDTAGAAEAELYVAGGWPDRDNASETGYGVFLHSPDAGTPVDSGIESDEAVVTDPNEAIIKAMSDEELRTYSKALYGDDGDIVYADRSEPVWELLDESEAASATNEAVAPEDALLVYDWRTAGCTGQAEHQVDGDIEAADEVWADEQYSDLVDEINNHWTNVSQSAPAEALYAEWRQCMDTHGVSGIENPDAAVGYFWDRFVEVSSVPGAFDDETNELKQTAEVKAHEAEERRTALADYDCRIEIDYVDRLRQADYDYQQEYLDSHRREVDGFRDALAYASGTGE